ncbi:MAG TPA: hypothetical protein VEX62_07065 [Candidatus Limnocylindrales bacterium]|nr:hypothetical protein [Candidatus Limnocylindrales bacterium]
MRDDGTALLFLHIPKTAGTSLVRELDLHFRADARLHLYDPSPDSIHPDDFPGLPYESRARLRFVAGHFEYGIHELIPRPARYITILRDPVDRIRSLYDHFRSNDEPGEADWHRWIKAHNADLQRFVNDQPTVQTDNYMVRLVSGLHPPLGACTPEMLAIAKAHLDTFSVVLIQEDMRPGLARLSELLEVTIDSLRELNVNRLRTESVPDTTRETIARRNSLDVELYAHAREVRPFG